MSRATTLFLLNLVVVGMILAAFTVGWWIGRTTTHDIETAGRLERIESELRERRATVNTAATRTHPTAPSGAAVSRSAPAPGPDPEKRHEIEIGDSPALGPENAPVTIVEFSDFECPYCASAGPTLERLEAEYPGRIRRVFKHNPMPFHRRALLAHRAAVAAHAQGKFWEMHDLLFASRDDLDRDSLIRRAKELELDLEFFADFLASAESTRSVSDDKALATRLGIMGVPSFFINGRYVAGAQSYDVFKKHVEAALSER